jgi:hypothetical protein
MSTLVLLSLSLSLSIYIYIYIERKGSLDNGYLDSEFLNKYEINLKNEKKITYEYVLILIERW